ncbi:sensor histidine kinase [Vagococcus acidifermentans]|uniref:histidine kinase n=1 Tax=Vagococcus acidifermentans TaxID=564710 RepID=A0A430APC5_9ENTE|nr:sensor histidine kinase [Vagococcus acidifermentans]RSU09949.1 hypothetical protein CBF27_11670 [Vagococcus acidifermentans]
MKTNKRLIRLVGSFMKERRLLFATYVLVCGAIALTLVLHDLPLVVFVDAFLFSGVLLLLISVWDFWGYYHHYRQLVRLNQLDHYDSSRLVDLPKPETIQQAEYQKLFMSAVKESEQLTSEFEEKNQQLMDYYAMWSHQIKTPLAALQVLVQSGSTDETLMKNELFSIEEYLKMMLHFLKMSHLEDDLVFKTVPLRPLVNQIIRRYAPFFIQKDLTVSIDPFEATVVTDEKWLAFILEQIIFNSIKYTKQGGITIHFTGSELVVEDTGIGILPQDLPRVFDKGYTGFSGREDKKATGLGLSMSRTIAERLGIHLSLSSEVGQGTQVTLHFPQHTYAYE